MKWHSYFSSRMRQVATCGVLVLPLGLVAPVWAAPTLKQAVEAAWQRQPELRSFDQRKAEADAKRDAASSWLADSPSLSIGHRTDRMNRNSGAREWEADLGLPLKTPGIRAALTATAESEGALNLARVEAARLRVAGEVRDLWWDVRLATNERDLAVRKAEDAKQLAMEVDRRVKAGDLALVDLNQARATAHQADATRLEQEAKLRRALRLFQAMTGLTDPGADIEVAGPSGPSHADITLAELTVNAQRARYSEATRVTADAPELTVGSRRERGLFGEAFESSLFVGVRIPFPTKSRNAPRIAAAGAELAEAEAQAALLKDRVQATTDSAEGDLKQASEIVRLADQRAVLARDTHTRLAKAFQLGEIDLVTRLRAEAERFDAELSLSRARLEEGRAVSRLNQAKGLLP